MNYFVSKGLKIRMVTILVLVGIGAAGIVARAVQIQILQSERLKKVASRQHKEMIEIRARRGDIHDSRGEALAISREEAQVFVRTGEVNDTSETAKKLASILSLDRAKLAKKLAAKDAFVWVSRSASLEQAEKIKALDLKGVGLLPASRRYYPNGSMAANLLGFTGVDGNGLEGLEFKYEDMLAGRPIRIWLERDARGNSFMLSNQSGDAGAAGGIAGRGADSLFEVDASGADLELTILRPLQYQAERELEKGIEAAGAKAGCVLAMDPETGAILAMASYPTFDPNHFSRYSQNEFRNRCVQAAYEPGSTFKVFTVAAALKNNAIRPNDRLFCEKGSYNLGGETIRDTKEHGWLSVQDVITYSSNIGASKIGERLGKDKLYREIQAFGFGVKTGLDFPGESSGLLRPASDWSQVAVGTISFGQGVAVTPLQMVAALTALANNGALMKPYLVKTADWPGGKRVINGAQLVRRVIDKETARTVTKFMVSVTGDDGTGKEAAIPGYTVAGKTGTAQKPKENERGYAEGLYVASFMGFVPAWRPRLVMIVVIDEPDPRRPYGGTVAAPVFRAIAEKAMVLLNVPSEDEAAPITHDDDSGERVARVSGNLTRIRQWEASRNWNGAAKKKTDNGAGSVPDLRGMTFRHAMRELDGMQVQVEATGSGIVVAQSPAPGASVSGQAVVRLRLEESP